VPRRAVVQRIALCQLQLPTLVAAAVAPLWLLMHRCRCRDPAIRLQPLQCLLPARSMLTRPLLGNEHHRSSTTKNEHHGAR
jgi:hypothetical protein